MRGGCDQGTRMRWSARVVCEGRMVLEGKSYGLGLKGKQQQPIRR